MNGHPTMLRPALSITPRFTVHPFYEFSRDRGWNRENSWPAHGSPAAGTKPSKRYEALTHIFFLKNIPFEAYLVSMNLIAIYECLCDRTRLRLLNLLLKGPLCGCHFQAVLREPQVKISKHLGYLKRNGLVESERCANLIIYRLPAQRPPQLAANLACLQDCVSTEQQFRCDNARLAQLRASFGPNCPRCIREPDSTRITWTAHPIPSRPRKAQAST